MNIFENYLTQINKIILESKNFLNLENIDNLNDITLEIPPEHLSSDFLSELKKKIPDIVYIYSANSAASFLRLIKNYDIGNLWMNTNLMCISEKTSSVLNEIKWKKIFIFRPGEEEFLLYKI